MRKSAVLFSFLFLASGQSWGNPQRPYELADLEILAGEENHREFFQHALDVRPSERLDTWRGLVSRMADSYGQSVLKKSTIEESDYRLVESIYQWPSLKNDEVFRLRRNDIGLRHLQECLKKEPRCWDKVKRFWESDSTDAEVGFKLAHFTTLYPGSPTPTWVYLQNALQGPLSEFYCQKDMVLDEIWKKFDLDYIRLGKQGSLSKKLESTLHVNCLPSLNQFARQRVLRPHNENDRELGYALLQAQEKVDTALKDFFLTVYLLESPSQGELFNFAWNNLRELARQPERREKVLAEIKKLELLPDRIAGSLDQLKRRVILTHFKSHFPEFLGHYANQCLNFYKGSGTFPQGNPTLHCSDLMTSEIAPGLFDSHQIREFQDIRKI